MASNYTSFQRWKPLQSHENDNDQGNLYLQQPQQNYHKSRKCCPGLWMLLLYVFIGCTIFSTGWLSGYLITNGLLSGRVTVGESLSLTGSNTTDSTTQEIENTYSHADVLNYVHKNVMYDITGENILHFYRLLQNQSRNSLSSQGEDVANTNFIKDQFHRFKFDRVEANKFNVSLDFPQQPNIVQILYPSGAVLKTINLTISKSNNVDNIPPFVAGSTSGDVTGELVDVGYGLTEDFTTLRHHGTNLTNRIALIRLGRTSVYQKLRNCEEYGISGALFFWHPDDVSLHKKDDVPLVSAFPTSLHSTGDRSNIIAATISATHAKLLLRRTTKLNSSHLTDLGDAKTNPLKIRLSVHNKRVNTTIHNAIGTISGFSQPDRQVIIGSSRSNPKFPHPESTVTTSLLLTIAQSLSQPIHDRQIVIGSSRYNPNFPHPESTVTTSLLLTIAESLSQSIHGHHKHKWRPRRTVKIVSWGGAMFSHLGLRKYLQDNLATFSSKTLAYFDLDSMVQGRDLFTITSPPSFTSLFSKVTQMVPAPNGEQMDTMWTKENLCVYPLPSHHYPILNIAAVPTVSAAFVDGKTASVPLHPTDLSTLQTSELNHHFRYHVAAARVLSLSLLSLADEPYTTNYDLITYVDYIYDRAMEIFVMIHHTADTRYNDLLEQLNSCLAEMDSRAKSFQAHLSTIDPITEPLKQRIADDALMLLDRSLLLLSPNYSSSHILSGAVTHGNKSDIFSTIMHKVRNTNTTQNSDEIMELLSHLLDRLQEASDSILLD